ncbi:MAG: hypothetical protein ABR604_00460 [Jatrophihabitantaceae bacterium]
MPGRHQQRPPTRVGLRWIAGALSAGIVGATSAAILATASPADASTPIPTYHPGSDTATFTVTGVLDSNCLVSTGGTEVWIKPGDAIKFNSSLAGINVATITALTGLIGTISGLNVDATIDANTTHAQSVSVLAGKTTVVPKVGQPALTTGDHALAWTAKSVTLVPLLGSAVTVALNSSELKSGATLSWKGVIHVTNDTANCKISVSTPQAAVSVGPIKVTVPPINVSIPIPTLPALPALPALPGLPGSSTGTTTHLSPKTTNSGAGVHYTPPPITVPEQAMGGLGGGGGGGLQPDANAASPLGINLPQVAVVADSPSARSSTAAAANPRVVTKKVNLAANKAPTAQLPVLLAIIAIIALSLVTATYARLYLLRRNA